MFVNRCKRSQCLAVFLMLSLIMSFSVAFITPEATADDQPEASTIEGSAGFDDSQIEGIEQAEDIPEEATSVEWVFEMTADPALGQPVLTLLFAGGGSQTASGQWLGSDGSVDTWQFTFKYSGQEIPSISGAEVNYVVTVVEEAPQILPEQLPQTELPQLESPLLSSSIPPVNTGDEEELNESQNPGADQSPEGDANQNQEFEGDQTSPGDQEPSGDQNPGSEGVSQGTQDGQGEPGSDNDLGTTGDQDNSGSPDTVGTSLTGEPSGPSGEPVAGDSKHPVQPRRTLAHGGDYQVPPTSPGFPDTLDLIFGITLKSATFGFEGSNTIIEKNMWVDSKSFNDRYYYFDQDGGVYWLFTVGPMEMIHPGYVYELTPMFASGNEGLLIDEGSIVYNDLVTCQDGSESWSGEGKPFLFRTQGEDELTGVKLEVTGPKSRISQPLPEIKDGVQYDVVLHSIYGPDQDDDWQNELVITKEYKGLSDAEAQNLTATFKVEGTIPIIESQQRSMPNQDGERYINRDIIKKTATFAFYVSITGNGQDDRIDLPPGTIAYFDDGSSPEDWGGYYLPDGTYTVEETGISGSVNGKVYTLADFVPKIYYPCGQSSARFENSYHNNEYQEVVVTNTRRQAAVAAVSNVTGSSNPVNTDNLPTSDAAETTGTSPAPTGVSPEPTGTSPEAPSTGDTPISVGPEAPQGAPAEPAAPGELPSTGAGNLAGIMLLASMFAGSGLVMRKAADK